MGCGSSEKFVPDAYKFASVASRTALLQGLLDTDGCVRKSDNNIEYTTVSPQLAEDVAFVVQSLGGTARIRTKNDGLRHCQWRAPRVQTRVPPECHPAPRDPALPSGAQGGDLQASTQVRTISGDRRCACSSGASRRNASRSTHLTGCISPTTASSPTTPHRSLPCCFRAQRSWADAGDLSDLGRRQLAARARRGLRLRCACWCTTGRSGLRARSLSRRPSSMTSCCQHVLAAAPRRRRASRA